MAETQWKLKKDAILTGILTGIAAPPFGFIIYYFWKFSDREFIPFFKLIVEVHMLSPVISLALILNLVAFFIFIWLKADRSAKGVLLATFLYGGLILILRYL